MSNTKGNSRQRFHREIRAWVENLFVALGSLYDKQR